MQTRVVKSLRKEIVKMCSHRPVGIPPHRREFERGGNNDGLLGISSLQNWIAPGMRCEGGRGQPHSKETDSEAVDDPNPRELWRVTPMEAREKKS